MSNGKAARLVNSVRRESYDGYILYWDHDREEAYFLRDDRVESFGYATVEEALEAQKANDIDWMVG